MVGNILMKTKYKLNCHCEEEGYGNSGAIMNTLLFAIKFRRDSRSFTEFSRRKKGINFYFVFLTRIALILTNYRRKYSNKN